MKGKLLKKVVAGICTVAMASQFAFVLPAFADATIYYEQNYENETDASSWKSNNAQDSLTLENSNSKFIQFSPGAANTRGAETNIEADTESVESYVVEFDAALTAGNRDATQFAVVGTDKKYNSNNQNSGLESGAIISLNANGNSTTWTINDSESVELTKGGWYHYNIIVDKSNKLASVIITDSEGAALIDKKIVGFNGSADIAGIYVQQGRYNGVTCIDNIVVRERTEEDIFGELEAEVINKAEWVHTPDSIIYQPEDGTSVDYPVNFKVTGNYGGDLTNDVSVKWNVVGLDGEDGYVTVTGIEDDSKNANINVRNGVSNYYCTISAEITYGDDTVTLTAPFAIIGGASEASNQLYPPSGYPIDMNNYSDELIGIFATSKDETSADPIFAGWSIYGSNATRYLTLKKDDDGDKYFEFGNTEAGGSTVANYSLPYQQTQYILDTMIKFSGDASIGNYYKTPNNSESEPKWSISYSGGAINAGTESISGVLNDTWYRLIVSADSSTNEYCVSLYDENDMLIGETPKVTMNETAHSPRYFSMSGTFPIKIKDMKIYKPVLNEISINADPTTVKVPEKGEGASKIDLSAVMSDLEGTEVTGVVTWAIEETDENVIIESTGPQTAVITVNEGAAGGILHVTATKDGKTATKEIQLTTSSDTVVFTKTTAGITIPFSGNDDVVAEYKAETRDKDGSVLTDDQITYALLDKTGTKETTIKGVTFKDGILTVTSDAVPAIAYIRATNKDGLSAKVKVNIHGLAFSFGTDEPAEGLTQVTAADMYSDKIGYGFESISGLTNSEITVEGSDSYKFKAKVPNGNYTVNVTTTSDSMKSEVIDGISASTGITKSGNAFNVAVCDGVLDLTFNAASSITSLSIAQTAAKQPLAKPALYAIGDSTTNNGDPNVSWGEIAGDFVNKDVFSSFSNNGKAGDDSVVYYNAGRLETVLLKVNPGDYVTVNMGINQRADGEAEAYPVLLENYYVQGIIQRGGIPVIVTATPIGPVWKGANTYNAETGKFTCSRGDGARNDVLRKIAEKYNLNIIELGLWGDEYFNSLTMEDVNNEELWGPYTWNESRQGVVSSNGAKPKSVIELVASWYGDHNHYTTPFANEVAKYILGEVEKIATKEDVDFDAIYGTATVEDNKVKIPVTTVGTGSEEANIFVAQYDKDDVLVNSVVKDETITESTTEIVIDFTSDENTSSMALYIWDKGMKPLSEVQTLSKN